jgi:serine/threonine protein kinase
LDPPKVALKFLNKEQMLNRFGGKKEEREETFLKEIEIHWTIREGPGVLKLKEIFEDDHFVVFSYDYYKHGTLYTQVTDDHYFSEDHVKHIIKQLLLTLHYFHDYCNIVHRDIKISNILIN